VKAFRESTMSYADTMSALRAKREQIETLREEMRAIQATIEPAPVDDYRFAGWDGPMRLSELFGAKRDLFVVHNMGAGCSYCTLWADGFNGVYEHLADRAGFVVASPNPVEQQKAFAASRGWRFPMVCHADNSFTQDMGYYRPGADPLGDRLGSWFPGVSVFRKDADRILRVSDAELGPYDDFCSVWHFLDLLPERTAGWAPKFRYA
jgi:predicted dithiol-disulfide oxidoreductase (DUF899 family)